MALLTNQQLNRYFDTYQDTEVTFTKEVIRATGLLPKKVMFKSLGYQWPCIIYSTSMKGAKIIANITSDSHEIIRKSNNLVSLRFVFAQNDSTEPLSFYVSARVAGYNPYNKEKPNLNFVSLEFTQRPPDDLIGILGNLLEANVNSTKRKEERITVEAASMKKMGLKSKSTQVYIQNIPRNCIIRDLSFSGAKVIIAGLAKYLLEKEAELHLPTIEHKTIAVKGTTIRHEPVEGRKDLAALAIKFHEDQIPMEYKMLINEYLKQKRKGMS
jgi:hypothetical protein